MNMREAADLIRKHFGIFSALQLWRLLKPSIRIYTDPIQLADLPLGASRFGGVPDLPPGFEWPKWTTRKRLGIKNLKEREFEWSDPMDIKLAFLAQINLKDLGPLSKTAQLPEAGRLFFFYDLETEPWGFDPNDRGAARVFYDCTNENLLQRQAYSQSTDDTEANCSSLRFVEEASLPGWVFKAAESRPEHLAYQELLTHLYGDAKTLHRINGHAQELQSPMAWECQLVTNGIYCGDPMAFWNWRSIAHAKGNSNWRLLLQLDSDEEAPWMWGDSGRLYFWIRRQELLARDFEKTWCILQCY
jgi:uncharacterized protein YwqG